MGSAQAAACGAESYSLVLGPDLSAELCNAGIYRHNKTTNLTLTLTLNPLSLITLTNPTPHRKFERS